MDYYYVLTGTVQTKIGKKTHKVGNYRLGRLTDHSGGAAVTEKEEKEGKKKEEKKREEGKKGKKEREEEITINRKI